MRGALKLVSDLHALQKSLVKELPMSILALESVKHQIKFNLQPRKEFYVSKDEKSSFVVIKERAHESLPIFTVFCKENDVERAEYELRDVIPWNKAWGMGGVPDYLLNPLREKTKTQGTEEHLEINDCWVLIMDPNVAMPPLDIPINTKARQVALSDVDVMDKLWKYQSNDTHQILRDQTELGLAFGAYVDGELKSSIVAFNFGALGAMATAETHRKQGLAQMGLIKAVEHLRLEGLTPFAFIETYNKPSFGLLTKTGFSHTHNASWVFWKRPK